MALVFQGEESFPQGIEEVWNALHDVEVLRRALPGCRSITDLGGGAYTVTLSLGVAAVKGDYDGKVRVTDIKHLSHYNIEGEGRGAPGFVKLRMDCRFERSADVTLMKWTCEATVGGLIASIGGKVLSGISKFMAQQFFGALRTELETGGCRLAVGSDRAQTSAATAFGSKAGGPRRGSWLVRFWRLLTRPFSREWSS